jgi:RNA polymerase sigma factor (sigma-70 family)
MDDRELLRQYVETQSEQAFAQLVERHVNLVYATALRLVDEPQMAQDVAQSVFIQLARKAGTVRDGNALSGWLYRAACGTAKDALRSECRRRKREIEAMNRNELRDEPQPAWEAIAPFLDEAVQKLNQAEQNLVVLRFFEGRTLRETGLALSLTEDAAQKRVSRALEKLRVHLARRGVAVSSALLLTALAAHSAQAAPVVPSSMAAASLAGAAKTASSGWASALTKILFMTTKTKIAIASAGIAVVVLAPVAVNYGYDHVGPNAWRRRFEAAYTLKPGEVLKHIDKHNPERMEYYRQDASFDLQRKSMSQPPDYIGFVQDQNGLKGVEAYGYVGSRNELQQVLRSILRFKRYELEGPDELLRLPVNGDWTFREGASRESLLTTLEEVLKKATGRTIHFQKQTVERDVVVVRGNYTAGKGATIHIFAEKSEDSAGGGSGDLQSVLDHIGDHLNVQLINETSAQPQEMINWRYHQDSSSLRMGKRRAELMSKVLQNLAAQTGLSFHEERRTIEVWQMTEEK